MFSGDICFTSDLTVKGAVIPDFKPEILITEATHGDRNAWNQALEEERLIRNVKAVQARGGHVLIPTRAAGQAQAIALLLVKSGLQVRLGGRLALNILNIYRVSRENITGIGDLSGDALVDAYHITTANQPMIVVATPETLSSELSRDFAYMWIGDERNAIFFPTFRFTEALGRKVLGARRGELVNFNERQKDNSIKFLAQVDQFRLSNHASGEELASWIKALGPKKIIMVHGTSRGFIGLEKHLRAVGVTSQIFVGANGKSIR